MKRLYQADFIRVISTFGIIIFHFSSEMAARGISGPSPLYQSANFSFGSLFVTVFFLLSGGMVHYSFKNGRYSVGQYYKKRFLNIFPAFYLIFFPLFLRAAFKHGSFFYNGRPASFLLSVTGMDGYFSYCFTTYYQIGEWFLGALILLYLIYPLLNLCASRSRIITTIVILVLYFSVFLPGELYRINDFQNLFSCLISFWFGMLLIEQRERLSKVRGYGWVSAGILLALLFVKLPVNGNVLSHLAGFFCFLFLYAAGEAVMKAAPFCKAVCYISSISYPVYLIHHVALVFFIERLPGGQWSALHVFFYLAAAIVLIISAGAAVDFILRGLRHFLRLHKKKQ